MEAHPVALHAHEEFLYLVTVDLTPPTIGANETVTQTYLVPRVHVGDFIWVTTLASFTGTCIVGAFVPAPGEVEVTWLNTHNQVITPEPTSGMLLFVRRPSLTFEAHAQQRPGG